MARRRLIEEGDTETKPLSETQPDDDMERVFPPESAGETVQQEAARERPNLPVSWANVVHDIKRVDVWSTYERLRDQLTFGDRFVNEYAIIVVALDRASDHFFSAIRLLAAAKMEEDNFERLVEKNFGVLRETAREALIKEKLVLAPKSSPRPSKEEVLDRMMASWPDEVGTLTAHKKELQAAVKAIEGLVDAWKLRSNALNEMAKHAAHSARR